MSAGNVLVILPSSRFMKSNAEAPCSVGYHLKELAVPVKELRQKDFQILIATPDGDTPFIDPHSLADVSEEERLFYEVLVKENTQLLLPLSLERMTEEFLGTVDGVLIPGGFATLLDFWDDPAIKHILKHMHKHCKPTAAIGHGTIALAYAIKEEESWAYLDYAMTCTPEAEDESAEETVLGFPLEPHVSAKLSEYGAALSYGPHNSGFIMEHKELITGQDASASRPVAYKLIEQLSRYQQNRCCS